MLEWKLLVPHVQLLTSAYVLLLIHSVQYTVGVTQNKLSESKGTFWHITDIHVDQNYSRTGDPSDLCHDSPTSKKTEDNGIYGNFLCDSPQRLLNLTIQAMQKINQNPDFIIWTGDNMPHTRHPTPPWNVVLEEINNVTKQLQKAFPGVPIYPSIGNHDTYPPNLLRPDSQYNEYLAGGGWKNILPESTLSTFEKGGYYSHRWKNGSRMISLNTILWYQSNSWVANETNPSQLKFLQDELNSAREKAELVYIIGHVPPGFYNRIYDGIASTPLYHLPYLRDYLQTIKNYSDVIAGQFFGHIHNDMFQLYYCDTGKAYSSGLLAGSVTPWHSNTKKNVNVSIPVNPSIRLMYYNRTSMLVLDYEQYFFNLTKANSLVQEDPPKMPEYELLYTFTDAYGVKDLSTESLVKVYELLKSNRTLFQKFFNYLTAGKKTVDCDDSCHTAQLCSMAGTSEDEYSSCMRTSDNPHHDDVGRNSHAVAYAVSFVCIFILIAIISLVIYKRRLWCWREKQSYSAYSGF